MLTMMLYAIGAILIIGGLYFAIVRPGAMHDFSRGPYAGLNQYEESIRKADRISYYITGGALVFGGLLTMVFSEMAVLLTVIASNTVRSANLSVGRTETVAAISQKEQKETNNLSPSDRPVDRH